ncbi:hypothetical protein LG201_01335 [Methylobacillus gramineus]|uniref:hypothetical protein n=1 Tax=Methylobacillus gramineus TaxID=755169 RepID=UPI001CFF877A|nr:hypothetical protein [Methylobacillus gramineus]MCB5183843.1 hypothetical protein [Methylobacillus gramineus]
MKLITLKLAVISALGIASSQVLATGLVSLPATGVSVSGGTSAYILCNTTGNFGSGFVTKPTTSANNVCAVFPANESTSPESGFSLVTSATRNAVMNNTYTGGVNKTVGQVTEYVWRNDAETECIYGLKIQNHNIDYHTAAGNQYFEVNDIARAGFSGLTISVGYSTIPTVSEPVYRIGRTFTSVQHRSSGYASQPLTGLGSSPSINGLNSYPGTASASQQLADINTNWVNFTTDVNFLDDDGSTVIASGMTYVKAACNSDDPEDHEYNNAIRLRQTFQELAGDGVTANSFIEVPVRGFVPPSYVPAGGIVTPAPTSPF